ncbi:sulfotransferase family 2 domain-containing protein [Cystobacter ferrugineus]|uniref:Sulfotransferase n=1 Tax=Cystobacter ferrugineus TaxID=83449 RepID=A0A1L9BFD2_9BACT|nr:sulfotransferase family 2 domain-containing protein [Cystobacter ferrugineus]OJH40969.1 hypothetical protein BON30_08645 [Cystobacter ferrugineus]
MIITDDFVYIHPPKTGGTFVTHVLERLYLGSPERPGLGRTFLNTHKHGTCGDIPAAHLGKPLLTTVRNPYDRYVSQYYFAWWKRHPDAYCGADAMKALHPHYPELSFDEFVRMANTLFLNCHQGRETGFRNERLADPFRPGWHTEQFIRFYCHEPRTVFASLDEEALVSRRYRQSLFPVHFLRSEFLNHQLHDFLLGLGMPRERISFILDEPKVFPEGGGRDEASHWQDHYTPELKRFVRSRERLLFEMFPEYDV